MSVCLDIYTYLFDTILSKKVDYVLCCTCTLNDSISITFHIHTFKAIPWNMPFECICREILFIDCLKINLIETNGLGI